MDSVRRRPIPRRLAEEIACEMGRARERVLRHTGTRGAIERAHRKHIAAIKAA